MIKQTEICGIKPELLSDVRNIFSNYSVEKAYLFGSRAKGTYKQNSDIDIAVSSDDNLNSTTLNMIRNDLEKIDTALCFDILNLDNINKPSLQENILKEGVLIYDRGN